MTRRRMVGPTAAGVLVMLSAPACSPAAGNTAPVIEIRPHVGFVPSSTEVQRGEPVVWSNTDAIVHRLEIAGHPPVIVLPGDVAVTRFDTVGDVLVRDTGSAEALAMVEVGDEGGDGP
jgi:hypothetical protein